MEPLRNVIFVQAVAFGKEIFADNPSLASSKLAETYLLIGSSSLGTGNLQQAELYLTQANWIITQAEDSEPALRSQLFRSLGRLYLAKGNGAQALKQLADDVCFFRRAVNTSACCSMCESSEQHHGGYLTHGHSR